MILVRFVLCAVSLVGAHRFSIRRVPGRRRSSKHGPARPDQRRTSDRQGFLARVVGQVRTLEPDVVMITGDLVDFGKVPAEELSPLATLEVPIFLCIGNHERYVDCDDICAASKATACACCAKRWTARRPVSWSWV